MILYVGDIVVPNDTSKIVLASGCQVYDSAVVACTNPFVLVSYEGDMLWNDLNPEDFKTVDYAKAFTLKIVIDRLNRDLQQLTINDHNRELTKTMFKQAYDFVASNSLEGFSRATDILKKRKG